MKSKNNLIFLAVTFSIVTILASIFILSKRNKSEYLQVRVISDSFGWVSFIEEPVISDVYIKVGESTLVYKYNECEMIFATILEVKEKTVVVELTLNNMYPTHIYSENVDFEVSEATTYIDEIPKNTCYSIYTFSADSGIVVYLTFDIKESEKHLTCGHGKALIVWYEGEEIRIGILKNKRIKSETDLIRYEVLESPMVVEEILGYLISSDCKICLSPIVVEIEEAKGYIVKRELTENEMFTLKKLYPGLPYCK